MRVEAQRFGHIHRRMEREILILQRLVSCRRSEEIKQRNLRKTNCRAAYRLSFKWTTGLSEQWSAIVCAWIDSVRFS